MLAGILSGAAAGDDSVPFRTADVALRAGVVLPVGSLARRFDPSFRVGVSGDASDWGDLRARLDLAYARMRGDRALHELFGGAGLDWRPASAPVEAGGSLAVFYVRGRHDPSRPRLDDDGETEFGYAVRIGIPVLSGRSWKARLEGQWEEAFTRPRLSAFGWAGISVSRKAW